MECCHSPHFSGSQVLDLNGLFKVNSKRILSFSSQNNALAITIPTLNIKLICVFVYDVVTMPPGIIMHKQKVIAYVRYKEWNLAFENFLDIPRRA